MLPFQMLVPGREVFDTSGEPSVVLKAFTPFLAGSWTMNEATGATRTDGVGSADLDTISGNESAVSGVDDNAVRLDQSASSGASEIKTSSGANAIHPTTSIFVSAWVYPIGYNSAGSVEAIVAVEDQWYLAWTVAENLLTCSHRASSNWESIQSSGFSFNTWHHILTTKHIDSVNGSFASLFVDGVLIEKKSVEGAFYATPGELVLGYQNSFPQLYRGHGVADEVNIFVDCPVVTDLRLAELARSLYNDGNGIWYNSTSGLWEETA